MWKVAVLCGWGAALAPAVALAQIEIEAELNLPTRGGDADCGLALSVWNRTNFTVETLGLQISFHDKAGNTVATDTAYVSYVDPGKRGAISVRARAPCTAANVVKLRAVSTCKIAGKVYSDCLDIIQLSTRWGTAGPFRFEK